MRLATQEEIEQACMTRSANEARAHLAGQGLSATMHHCHLAVARLVTDGIRGKLVTGKPTTPIVDVSYAAAADSCQRLLDATMAAYRRKARSTGLSVEQVMASSLYAPETVAAWRAAA